MSCCIEEIEPISRLVSGKTEVDVTEPLSSPYLNHARGAGSLRKSILGFACGLRAFSP